MILAITHPCSAFGKPWMRKQRLEHVIVRAPPPETRGGRVRGMGGALDPSEGLRHEGGYSRAANKEPTMISEQSQLVKPTI